MNVGAVSDMSSYLINQATAMNSGKVQQQIQSAVLKQAMDQQKTEGEALVRMIQNTPGAPGSLVDIRV